MHKDDFIKITIGIIALNEEEYLPDLLDDILNQTYDKQYMELVLVDSGSVDSTLHIFEKFKLDNQAAYASIQILKNKGRNQASGWNTVIANYTMDALIRIDAHSRLTSDFIEQNVVALNKGENVTGGLRSVVNKESSNWDNTLWLAEMSLFGSSIASYRRAESDRYVNSVFHACYRREVLDKVGFFNEKLGRTEDNEFHYRVRQAGYKLFYTPKIKSYQLIRSDLKKMVKQKYGNGYWIGKTVYVCPKCLEIYHFIPFTFVLALFFTLLCFIFNFPYFLYALAMAYGLFDILNTGLCMRDEKFNITSLSLLFIFPLLHIAYGWGTIRGLLSGGIHE